MKRKFLLHYVKELLNIILFIQEKNFVRSRKEFCSFKKKMTGINNESLYKVLRISAQNRKGQTKKSHNKEL